MAIPICRMLDKQLVDLAFSRAEEKTGNRIAESIEIIAITTNNSIRVKPLVKVSLRLNTESPSIIIRMNWSLRYDYNGLSAFCK